MSLHFCTLFDKNYLFKGLALHESLRRHAGDFTLWVLCMDDVTYEVLGQMDLPNLRRVALSEFEDAELLEIKPTRSPVEYCWTCTPSLLLYLLQTVPDIETITYLDADLFFSADPTPLFAELGRGSAMIVEHRFAPQYEHKAEEAGIYNVEFLVFRNDERARTILHWWRDRCNEWCYAEPEDGRFGDQKYLDDWPERFEGVVVLQHKGGGLAPWNLDRYTISTRNGVVYVDEAPLIFYHFHEYTLLRDGRSFKPAYSGYTFSRRSLSVIYRPYAAAIREAVAATRAVSPGYSFGIAKPTLVQRGKDVLRPAKRAVLGRIASVRPRTHAHRNMADSWKDEDVARRQEELVMTELAHPQDVAPFKTFLEMASYIVSEFDNEVVRFLDVGCGVGHYSALLDRFYPEQFEYTGADYSPAMIHRARALWPGKEFVVDDIFDTHLEYSSHDILMASALVDVIDDFRAVLDILFANTAKLLILHRQRTTKRRSYSEPAPGYEGQMTYATYLNPSELAERAKAQGLRIRKEFTVAEGIRSFLLERTEEAA